MQTRILDIFRNSGDDNLGQTLARLARLAEQQHDAEADTQRQGPVHNGIDRDVRFMTPQVRTEVDP